MVEVLGRAGGLPSDPILTGLIRTVLCTIHIVTISPTSTTRGVWQNIEQGDGDCLKSSTYIHIYLSSQIAYLLG
jgi:hypothetical protein